MNLINKLSTIIFLAIYNNNLLAQNCDPSDQACLTAPEGILSGNAKVDQAMTFINWMFFSVSMGGAIVFGMKAAKKLSDEQWGPAIGPMAGSILCGLTTYVAFSIIN